MRTIMKITDPALWIECKYSEKDKGNPYRVYKLCRFIGQCGYPTTHRKLIAKCDSIRSVMQLMASLCR